MKTKTFTQNISLCILLLMGCLCYNPAFAQVAITTDGTPPDGSAMLDVKSADKGLLLPRMTRADIQAITTPANGLIVYNTDDNHFYYFDDAVGGWKEIAIGTGTILPSFECGDVLVDPRDDQTYTTVQIGNQCWMAENLNYETSNTWWYDNSSANGDVYGRLYTWDAALTACPPNWHLPSDDEWKQLERYLGMSQIEADHEDWRGIYEGEKLKSISGWNNNGNGTDEFGFSALPGGYRYYGGSFDDLGDGGYWWSATEDYSVSAWYRGLYYGSDKVARNINYGEDGFSVRCLRD